MDQMSFSNNDNEQVFQKLAAYHLNELETTERQEVESWIQASETNAKQYQAVQSFWSKVQLRK